MDKNQEGDAGNCTHEFLIQQQKNCPLQMATGSLHQEL